MEASTQKLFALCERVELVCDTQVCFYTNIQICEHTRCRLCKYVYIYIYVYMHAYVYGCVCVSMILLDTLRRCY